MAKKDSNSGLLSALLLVTDGTAYRPNTENFFKFEFSCQHLKKSNFMLKSVLQHFKTEAQLETNDWY